MSASTYKLVPRDEFEEFIKNYRIYTLTNGLPIDPNTNKPTVVAIRIANLILSSNIELPEELFEVS